MKDKKQKERAIAGRLMRSVKFDDESLSNQKEISKKRANYIKKVSSKALQAAMA